MAALEFSAGYALVVGTGTNSKGKLHHSFRSTIHDAEWVARVLQHQSLCAFPRSQVKVLLGEEATRQNIITELDKLTLMIKTHTIRNEAGDGDKTTLVVFFSGHGYQDEETYLIPYGYNFKRMTPAADAISGELLHEKLMLSGADKILLLLNSCYSGGLAPKPRLGEDRVLLGPLTKAHIKKLSKGTGFAFLSSAQSMQETQTGYLANNGKRYSPFTIGISRGFSGKGKRQSDGLVYVEDIMISCSIYVREKTKNEQVPLFEYTGDNFPVGLHKANTWSFNQFPLLGEDLVYDLDEVSDLESEEEEKKYIPHRPTRTVQNSVYVRGSINVSQGHVILGSSFGNNCDLTYNN